MTAILFTVAQDTTVENFLAHAAEGKVQIHKERDNGTTRRVHFLAPDTEAREMADFIQGCRDEGLTMKAISGKVNLSVAAVRRILNDLIMTVELEEADAEELSDLLFGGEEDEELTALANRADTAEDTEAPDTTEQVATEQV